MSKKSYFSVLLFVGILLTLTGVKKIINLETIPDESLCYNVGHYCGIYARAFVGFALIYKGVLNLKYGT
jgi:hypothetical protein